MEFDISFFIPTPTIRFKTLSCFASYHVVFLREPQIGRFAHYPVWACLPLLCFIAVVWEHSQCGAPPPCLFLGGSCFLVPGLSMYFLRSLGPLYLLFLGLKSQPLNMSHSHRDLRSINCVKWACGSGTGPSLSPPPHFSALWACGACEVNWCSTNFHLICSVVKLIYLFYLIESPGTESFALIYWLVLCFHHYFWSLSAVNIG